jgi:hypothetical protein
LTFLHGGAAVFHVYSADIPGQIQKGHRSGSGQVHIKSPSGACQTEADEYQVRVGPGTGQTPSRARSDLHQVHDRSGPGSDQTQIGFSWRSEPVSDRKESDQKHETPWHVFNDTRLERRCFWCNSPELNAFGKIRKFPKNLGDPLMCGPLMPHGCNKTEHLERAAHVPPDPLKNQRPREQRVPKVCGNRNVLHGPELLMPLFLILQGVRGILLPCKNRSVLPQPRGTRGPLKSTKTMTSLSVVSPLLLIVFSLSVLSCWSVGSWSVVSCWPSVLGLSSPVSRSVIRHFSLIVDFRFIEKS